MQSVNNSFFKSYQDPFLPSTISPISNVANKMLEQEKKTESNDLKEISSQDWDGALYQKVNTPQESIALMLLKEISLDNQYVLDVGCGSGNITAFMAKKAASVLGIDKSKSMIHTALQTYNVPNQLKFEILSAEEMAFSKQFDLITFFFCVNWFKDKPKAFKNFFNALKINGTIFGTIRIQESLVPNQILEALDRILPDLKLQFPQLEHVNMNTLTEYHIPTKAEIFSLLEELGFKDILITPKLWNQIFKNKKDLYLYIKPIIMSTPIAKLIPKESHELFLNKLVDNVESHLEITPQKTLIYPMSPVHIRATKPLVE